MKLRDLNPGDRFIFSGMNGAGEIVEIYRGTYIGAYGDNRVLVRPDNEDGNYIEDNWNVDVEEGE